MKPKLLTTIEGYNPRQFAADALAGVTVAMVALPLSIAIAIASGATPAAGLATATVGGLLISLLGGSRVQIGGPTGAFIVVVYGVIEQFGFDGLLLATLMAGLILVFAGLVRAGRLIALIPEAVIEGFTIGIALIIGISQLKDLLGLSIARLPADLVEAVPALWNARSSISPAATAVGLASIGAIALLRRRAGSIVAIALASAAVALLSLPVETIHARFGDLPSGLPYPSLPPMSVGRVIELFPSALVIAFLAGVESLLSALVADRMVGGAHRSNAELLAQGAANIASPLFGGLPATGAIARTAANVRAGGRTPVAGIVHALAILLFVVVAAQLMAHLAMPAMAALLMVTAWSMSEPHRWREHLRARRADRFLLLLTMVLTVLSDLTVAIAVGTAVGLGQRLVRRNVGPAEWTPPDR
ncbi:SulP family inorganic anion transporter [Sphingomonas rhizophila]|uniref:SulP family inorganic anion transporter n=1 Tax=Sphingomonas rhizophila TaxID=2071607 RepID=A0A7G9S9Y1_9SPHN|nr:SulP family inorganic anion transporter [Sphingomonas rhizophila]QNN64656.1 SulP family inorganic anion transporter [Sphingomonas rhizophila]